MKYYEVMFDDGYSIAIKAEREPTLEEAQEFCQYKYGKAIEVLQIDEYETRTFFDCSNIDNWPIFGKE